MKVYVAGPYTLGDVAVNVRNAIMAGVQLLDAGHQPFIPHLYHFVHMHQPFLYEVWTACDNAFLPDCDALIRLAGESSGSDAEVELAERLNIPVYPSVLHFLDTVSRTQD